MHLARGDAGAAFAAAERARTGLTRGMITDVDESEIEVHPLDPFTRMSNKGDSGSVYVSLATGMVCALHNQGDGTLGFGILDFYLFGRAGVAPGMTAEQAY